MAIHSSAASAHRNAGSRPPAIEKTLRLLLVVAALGTASAAHAQRFVVVNGERLNGAQIARLQQLNCAHVPNGRYWLDMRSGAWGYANNPLQQGFVGDACRRGQRHKSLSERGRLFRPGEILNGR